MEYVSTISAVVVSIIAVGISVLNLILTRKHLYATIVATNRTSWMEQMRRLLFSFIKLYSCQDRDIVKLKNMVAHINLYINPKDNPTHKELSDILDKMINTGDIELHQLIECCQNIFADAWNIIKFESNIDLRQAKYIKNKIYTSSTE